MIATADLSLHSGSPDDWEMMYHNFWSHEDVFRYLFSRASATPSEAQKRTAAYAAMHKEAQTEFFVYEACSGQPIGVAGIKELAPSCWTVTDLAIGSDFQRRGYGRQILMALQELAFAKYGASQLSYDCFSDNEASKHLALSCGFTYSHSEQAELKKNGQPVTLDYYILCPAAHPPCPAI